MSCLNLITPESLIKLLSFIFETMADINSKTVKRCEPCDYFVPAHKK